MKDKSAPAMRKTLKLGAWTAIVMGLVVMYTGDVQAKIMVDQQPMKMAAAEAVYETAENVPFSIITVGNLDGSEAYWALDIPGLTSFLATGYWDGPESTVQGINNLQAQYLEQFPQYGPEMNFVPYVPVTYWGFRLMIGLGMIAALYALFVLWLFRGGRTPKSRLFAVLNSVIVLFPLFGISAGWIFTEMGRQPWIVFGEQIVADGVSPLLTPFEVWVSMIGFTVLYAVLAIIEVALLLKYIRAGAPETVVEDPYAEAQNDDDKQLYFAY
jgi:cytochrome d ubiquinol oxidase subunit I